jgi:cell division protein FtsB
MRGLKNRGEHIGKRVTIFFVLVLILCALTNSVYKVYSKRVEAQKTLARMQDEIKAMEEREGQLAASLKRLETDEGMALEMRKKLNVAEAGESVAIIVDDNKSVSVPVAQTSPWQKFKNFVVDLFK